jgi:hypothetical protein
MKVYFTDWFRVDPDVLDEYGAFNVSLVNDLPLFIDPFLLFTSKKPAYHALHDQIIAYLQFLRDQAVDGGVDEGLLRSWYMFPEVKQLWLGFSLCGNNGSGLGIEFAEALHKNLNIVFKDFGDEKVTKGSHLEKVCLVRGGVGRDNISDFTANLIKAYLLEYTQTFCQKHVDKSLRRLVNVPNVRFDYETQVWCPATYELPFMFGDYVVLTPRDLLTKDENWINRHDMFRRFEEIVQAVPDQQLRSRINKYLMRQLKRRPTQKDRDRAYETLLQDNPALIEWYIKWKEDNGGEAVKQSKLKVTDSEERFIKQCGQLIQKLETETEFYKHGIDTFEECRSRILFLKKEIESSGAFRLFYHKGKPIERESDLQILFRLTWFATPSDFNSEVNNGRGPVDFAISRGSKDKTIVEFKLAKNSKLKRNLEKQVKIYEAANNTRKSLKVIFYFTSGEHSSVKTILKELKLETDETILLIDCRKDNKPSASKA